jgi:predicted acyltransferase
MTQAVGRVSDISVGGAHLGQRFISLDVFRGITVCMMIIVNAPGRGAHAYSYLVHAKWIGFTLADLVFPSFLFAVGNAMSFSQRKFDEVGDSYFLKKVFKRALLIFVIGYLLYWFPFFQQSDVGSWSVKPFSETRIMGVLQRISLCYLACALMIRYLSPLTTAIAAGSILLVYWAVLYAFGDGGEYSMQGNAITKLDIFLFGASHVYKKDVMIFDPEGLLSTAPAIVNVLAGYWVGKLIQKQGKTKESLMNLLLAGGILILLALAWHVVFPISKKLWTSSFVLCTVGIDILLLAALVYWIEMRRRDFGTYFFSVFGKNPLFIYLLAEVFHISLMQLRLPPGQSAFEWVSIVVFQTIAPGPFGSLLTAITFMLLCWLVGLWLDKKQIYLRI